MESSGSPVQTLERVPTSIPAASKGPVLRRFITVVIPMHGKLCWQLCSAKPEVSEEDRKREAVRAQLEEITQEYKAVQEQARSAAQQLKCASTQMHGYILG